ncbi:unnamed protein product [Lota lota]
MAMIHPQVMTIQPGVVTSTVEAGREMWSTSLFSCCDDMGICCLGFCFPCVLACQVSSDHGEGLCLPMLEMLSGIVPAVAMGLRISVRERYRIQGSICDDCCVVTFCSSCSYCQMARELKKRRNRHPCHITSTTVQVTSNPPPYVPHYPSEQGYAQPQ